jgi:DNA-binding protein HU-beta
MLPRKIAFFPNKDNVYLRGFGTFAIKHRAPKTARNILKDTTILVEARDK